MDFREVLKQLNRRTAASAKKRLENKRRVLKHAEGEAGPLAAYRRGAEQVMQDYETYV